MWASRPARAIGIVAVFVLALLLDGAIETAHLRPGRHALALVDFPSGLLVLPVPVGAALLQSGVETPTVEWVGRSLWLVYLGLSTRIVVVTKRSHVIGFSIVLLLMLSFNLLGILVMAALSGIG